MATRSLPQVVVLGGVRPQRAVAVALIASLLVLVGLLAIIYGHGRPADAPRWASKLPALNALLNGTSAVFLVRAYRLRRRDNRAHARNMLRALAASGAFLVSYVVYHSLHGD